MEINKYNKGKIYTIRSPHTDKYYIGSTCNELRIRFMAHKAPSNKCESKEIIELGEAYIELLENFPCNSKDELNKREGELIRQYKNNVINKIVNGRTIKEYKQDNKDKIDEYMKDYRIDNKEQIKEKAKEWHLKNREKELKRMKEYNKQYREQNKEQLKEQKEEYYLLNKKKISEKKKEKMVCECGAEFRKEDKARHFRSQKHITFINK